MSFFVFIECVFALFLWKIGRKKDERGDELRWAHWVLFPTIGRNGKEMERGRKHDMFSNKYIHLAACALEHSPSPPLSTPSFWHFCKDHLNSRQKWVWVSQRKLKTFRDYCNLENQGENCNSKSLRFLNLRRTGSWVSQRKCNFLVCAFKWWLL